MHNVTRAALQSIRYLLKHFPCVAVIGARQTGKTTLLKQVLPDGPFFDLEKTGDLDRISHDPDFFLSQFDEPIAIDEAQALPSLFTSLRVAVDANRNKNGRFLISGSSYPALLTHITESMAGRIAIFQLEGLSLNEAWGKPVSPLYELLIRRDVRKMLALEPRYTAKLLFEKCFFGSYPEPFLRDRRDRKLFTLWMENYTQSYVRRDVRNLFPHMDIESYRRFIGMLAGSSGQILNYSDFARSLDVSQPTIKSYFQIAHGTFIWRMIPSYQKQVRKRIVKMPKGHMRDTGLLNHTMKIQDVAALHSHPLVGRIWETFVIEELLKGFGNTLTPVEPFYYRTSNGAEIDLILEGSFGLIPFEIKLGSSVQPGKLTALEDFIQEHNLPFGIVLNNASEPARITRNILQLPVGCL